MQFMLGVLGCRSVTIEERNNRKDVDSEVFVLEPNYQLRGQIPVNGYGQILDIQLLSR